MVPVIGTDRLQLRPWTPADAPAAVEVFGPSGASTWMSSGTGDVEDLAAMRDLFERWAAHDAVAPAPSGHWALERRAGSRLIGGLALDRVPWDPDDVRMTWELAPSEWGNGYAVEACDALLRWAIEDMGALQVFAVIPPDNGRALATAERIGMECVREVGRDRLQVYRIRHGELGAPDG